MRSSSAPSNGSCAGCFRIHASTTDGEVRAFTSTTYGRIWDALVVDAVRRINQDDRWHVPLKAYDGQNSKQATTLYASDRDVFLFLVDEARPIELEGRTYFRGFYTWNSEVMRHVGA